MSTIKLSAKWEEPIKEEHQLVSAIRNLILSLDRSTCGNPEYLYRFHFELSEDVLKCIPKSWGKISETKLFDIPIVKVEGEQICELVHTNKDASAVVNNSK